jgi:hypothetical protein
MQPPWVLVQKAFTSAAFHSDALTLAATHQPRMRMLQVLPRARQPAISPKLSVFRRVDIMRRVCARRLWCLSPLNSRFASSFPASQLTPLHAAPLLRPHVDAVVLPGWPAVREFWSFVRALTGLQEEQVHKDALAALWHQ